MKKSICVLGSLNYDYIVSQDRMPVLGETYIGKELFEFCGGKGANQAAQCGKLGVPTFFIGKVGKDNNGQIMIDSLKRYGVNAYYVSQSPTSNSGSAVVHVMPDGGYYSTILKGANFDISIEEINHAEEIIKNSKIIIFQLENPLGVIEHTMSLAKKHGVYVILNAAPAQNLSDNMFQHIDCLIVNETEATFYSDGDVHTVEDATSAARNLYNKVNDIVVVTLGEKGSIAYDGNEDYFIPAKKVTGVDTTGAGDSYTAGLAYSFYNDWDLKKAMEFATKISAISITKNGGQNSFPWIKDL